jgi:sulfur carrier protein
MHVKVNGEKTAVDDGATLASLIEHLAKPKTPRGIAAAVNGAVVPREKWEEIKLQEGDTVEIIRAVQGG